VVGQNAEIADTRN